MQQGELEIRFQAGELTKAILVPEAFGIDWNLMLRGKNKSTQYIVTPQRGDDARKFKAIDAAAKVARKIGFIEVSVKFPELAR
ncbi:hypothetical protein A165_08245 [Vibrio tasmaniensis ZS-17]|uniref:hypothetical protein n=1 Tax=Vibrio TaxID=662 RepID=UPI0002FA06A2|nr:hypothetical protein [Vibrio tasmaniensis]OED67144.1 hypothetical protein A165_08245 [Vibrio tasmaniensis ZS-17]